MTQVLLRRGFDAAELCALPRHVRFAAAFNGGFEARTCHTPSGDYDAAERCDACAHHGVSAAEAEGSHWVHRAMREPRADGARASPPCRYEFNTGVFVVTPLPAELFAREVTLTKVL